MSVAVVTLSNRKALIRLDGCAMAENDGLVTLMLDDDEARWLQAVALPTALAAMAAVPSDPPASIEDDGQIAGQTTIDEVLDAAQ